MGFADEIEAHLDNKEDHEVPMSPGCHRCGGTVMTPTYDFADMESGYGVQWENKFESPFEYAVFGWARSH